MKRETSGALMRRVLHLAACHRYSRQPWIAFQPWIARLNQQQAPESDASVRVAEADGPYGPTEPLEFEINLSDWREGLDAPDGSLHLVRNAIKDLSKELKRVGDRSARAISQSTGPVMTAAPEQFDRTTHLDSMVIEGPEQPVARRAAETRGEPTTSVDADA